ncbi:MAG TPA: polyprenyl diphosphate synthase [Actinomycetota bacterium]|nr:polyprenyl diphosphate synthase [Actinomycetota bacterium]
MKGAAEAPEAEVELPAGASVPNHLAIIPDGNRRWAAARGESVTTGHRAGFEVAKQLSRFCRKIGIHTATFWAFSTENWRRSPGEVAALLALYEEWIADLLPEAIEEHVRIIHVGRLEGVPDDSREAAAAAGFPEGLPQSLKEALVDIEQKTRSFDRNVVNLAINYGGADEVKRAVERLFDQIRLTGRHPSELEVADFLDTANQPYPNPDIVWRTSGEMRSSGFLPLQSTYAEMVFTPKFFPDLGDQDVLDCVLEYSARIRRFGG